MTTIPTLSTAICGPKTEFLHFISIVNNVDTFVTLIIPFVAILVMNCRIAVKVIQFYKERKHLALQHAYTSTHGSSGGGHGGSGHQTCVQNHHPARHSHSSGHTPQSQETPRQDSNRSTKTAKAHYTRTQVRVTKMLLLVSSSFLALNLPRHTVRTYSFVMSMLDHSYTPSSSHIVWQKFFQFLYYLQFSVNVFLYSAFGKNFRKALLHLGKKLRHKFVECRQHSICLCGRGRRVLFRTTKTEILMKDYRTQNVSVADSKYV